MKPTRRHLTQVSLLAAPTLLLSHRSGMAQISEMPVAVASEARQIAIDAYVYGYSLMTTEVTRVQMSNVTKAEGLHAPTGEFINVKRYPPANFRAVSAPNADTLYSLVWLDLSEPQVFSHPDMGNRFYLFEMTDLWMTDFASPGQRTSGGKAASYLLTGPGWSGSVPNGVQQIKCATRYMVILGRTYADGTEKDYEAVNALQAQYRIVPLNSYGKPFSYRAPAVTKPGFSMTDAPQKVLLDMPIATYFGMMAKLMGSSAPPAAEDAPMLARIARIGLVPGKRFDAAKQGETPPVKGFWSITMYEIDKGWWFVPNKLNRFTASMRKSNVQPRRVADAVVPERVARQGQGEQLAAGAEGRLHPDAADVLAESDQPVDPRWLLEATSS
jgi:hypothetical protein